MNKKILSERDLSKRPITPAIALIEGYDLKNHAYAKTFTNGRLTAQGKG